MPIPESEIARIKKSTDLPALARSQGVVLTRMGKDLAGKCPFHEDDTPSLKLTEKSEGWLYHCFGCGRGGDCYTFVMETEGVTFPVAHEMLSNGYVSGDQEVSRLLACPVTADMDETTMLMRVAEYYHQILLNSEVALEYLKKREIYNEEVIRKFKIGFCDRSLGRKIPSKTTAEGAMIREKLTSLGILRQGSGHEHFRGSLIIPIISEDGEVTELYGRKINSNLRSGTPHHLYLPGPHKGIWNPECLSSPEIILCESLIDALTWVCNGFPNVTSTYGAGGLTDEMIEAFKAHNTKTIYLSQDADEAGDSAAMRGSKGLAEINIESYRIQFPRGMAANEYAIKLQPAQKSLKMALGIVSLQKIL